MTVPDQLESRQLDLGPAQSFEPQPESPPGNQIDLREGWMKASIALIQKTIQTSVGFTPVSASDKVRWDLVYIDLAGAVQTIPGAEQTKPVADFTGAPNPVARSFPIALVKVDETASVVVTSDDIEDVRTSYNLLQNLAYTNSYAITPATDYHMEALSKLSTEAERMKTFAGKDNLTQSLPEYSTKSGPEYAVPDDMPLANAVAQLDLEANRVKTFIGKDNLADTSPDYSSNNIVSDGDSLETAIGKLDAATYLASLQAGFMMPWPMATPPSGWVECDGSLLLIATYPNLHAVIGTTYGGDGITTFGVPDFRGEFIRGWDHGRGKDPNAGTRTDRGDGTTGDNVGTKQDDKFKTHRHTSPANFSGTTGYNAHSGTNDPPTGYVNGTYTGGDETRPTNVYAMICMKY